jgi:hypothetical protein
MNASRFPSLSTLNVMTINERSFAVERQINELRRERYGIECGHIKPWNGKSKSQLQRERR